MAKLGLLLISGAFPLILHAQEPAYYVKNLNGNELTAVHRGDPSAVQPLYWAMYYYKPGSPRGNGHEPWGMESQRTLDALMRAHQANQKFEIRWCKWVQREVPCDQDTYVNYLGPIAVLDEPIATKATVKQSSDQNTEPAYPSGQETQRAVLTKVIGHWGEQLKEVRNKLIELELHHGAAESNPVENVGNVTKEYSEVLKDATEQYSALRALLTKVGTANVLADPELERRSQQFDGDISRLRAISLPAPEKHQRTTATSPGQTIAVTPTEESAPPVADSRGSVTVHDPGSSPTDNSQRSGVDQVFGDETFNRANAEFNRGQGLAMAASRNRSCSTAREAQSALEKAVADYGAVTGVNEATASTQRSLARSYLVIAQRQTTLNCR